MEYISLYIIKILRILKLVNYINIQFNKKINGIKVKIPIINGIGISNFVIRTNWLDSLINQFIQSNNSIFVDAGTNTGQTLLKVKTLKPDMKYVGFEPNSACIYYTQKLIKSNKFKHCALYNCALSSSIEFQILGKTLVDDSRASIIKQLRPGYFENQEQILSIDFDTFFIDQNISFIKIDVEGSELEVINGMKNSIIKHQPIIVCEVLDSHHPLVHDYTQKRANDLTRLLQSLKYSMIRIYTDKKTQSIASYSKIDSIDLIQWTQESKNTNDYLFYPSKDEKFILLAFQKLLIQDFYFKL